MAVDILSKSQAIGWLQQANPRTAKALSDAFEALRVDAGSLRLDADADYSTNDTTSVTGLMIERTRSLTDITSGMPKVDFSMPADLQNIAPLFYLALGNTTEVITTPYQKVITPAWTSAVPDYSSDNATAVPPVWTLAGYRYSSALDAWLLEDAILNTMSFSIDFNARGVAKLAQVSGQFVGSAITYEGELTQALSDAYTSTWLNDSDDAFTLTLAGIITDTVCIKRYTLTINNNVTSDCKTTGGKANNYKLNPEITCEIVIPYNSATYAGMKLALDGTETTMTLSKGTTGQTGYVNVVTKGRIIGNPHPADSGGYQDMTLTLRCEKPSSGHAITVTVADAVDRNYPAPS